MSRLWSDAGRVRAGLRRRAGTGLRRGLRRSLHVVGGRVPAGVRDRVSRSLGQPGVLLEPPPPVADRLLVSQLRAARLRPDGRYELTGWAFRSGSADPDTVAIVAIGPTGTPPVTFPAALVADEEVNAADVDTETDRTGATFRAVLDPADLTARRARDHRSADRWRVEVRVGDREGVRTEPFGTVARFSSAGSLPPVQVGRRHLVSARLDPTEGLSLLVESPDVLAAQVRVDGASEGAGHGAGDGAEADGRPVRVGLAPVVGFRPWRAYAFPTPENPVPFGIPAVGRRVSVPLDRWHNQVLVDPARFTGKRVRNHPSWQLELADPLGRRRTVRWALPPERSEPTSGRGGMVLGSGPDATLRVEVGAAAVRATEIEIVPGPPERLRIRLVGLVTDTVRSLTGIGSTDAVTTGPVPAWLAGQRHRIDADRVTADRDGVWVEVTLRERSPFTDPTTDPTTDLTDEVRPASSGRWRLLLDPRLVPSGPAGRPVGVGIGHALAARMGERTQLESLSVRIERTGAGELAVRIAAPRPVGESGRYRSREIDRSLARTPPEPADAVVFDCFDGKSAGDSPGSIRAELLARHPGLAEYWVVSDRSVPIPAGATGLVWRSREYFEVRARARYLVTNCWLSGEFQRHPGQRVLQTWHGTPLKRLGTDRIGFNDTPQQRRTLAEQTAQWNWLISQNPYSTEIFTRAYLYEGEVAPIGYPRNDPLTAPLDHAQESRIRARLGLAADERVVLFAPTWRESGANALTALDLGRLTARLGEQYRVLVRGHANTVAGKAEVRRSRVVDVTLYPDLADLIRLSEVLITDYSSIMFDYSVTGKPMVFYVPDLEDYAGSARGTYFDLAETAPGPLVRRPDAVAEEIELAADGVPAAHAARYSEWRATFNPWDDGGASARAVDLLLAAD